jgi:hypothetical protein
MTPGERLRRAQGRLALAALCTAVSESACLGVLGYSALQAVGLAHAPAISLLMTALFLGVLVWRFRKLRSLSALALWMEEANPAAEYALVTLTDGVESVALAEAAGQVDIEGRTGAALHRLGIQALVACGLAGALWFTVGRNLGHPLHEESAARSAEAPSRLTPLTVRITPPAYSHLASRSLADPATVEALAGSEVQLSGSGPAAGVTVDTSDKAIAVSAAGARWSTQFRMPQSPGVVHLHDRGYSRLVVLAPRIDSVPEVILERPLHDTTYRVLPTGPVTLDAAARDDIGLAAGYFEYLITIGGDENFTTTTRTSARQSLGDRREAQLHASLRLDTLHLTPGSVVSIRAIVLDGNDVTGPGKGFSETRTLRLAERADSTSVNAAPPDQVDSMLISQRLLNMRTDSLIRARASMNRKAVNDRSMTHSNTQESIRQRVLTVIGVIEDDGQGGTAPTDVSKLLRVAADEMGSARIELALVRPTVAMPHMKKALAILDQVRLANRYYLRGRQPVQLVDLEKVRLKGEGTPVPSPLQPRSRLEEPLGALAARIEAAARLYPSAPEAARDSLTLVRVAALSRSQALADALAHALEALQRGSSADVALEPVRQLVAPSALRLAGPAEWTGVTTP